MRPCAWHSNSTKATVADLREPDTGSSRIPLCLRVFDSDMVKLRACLREVYPRGARRGTVVQYRNNGTSEDRAPVPTIFLEDTALHRRSRPTSALIRVPLGLKGTGDLATCVDRVWYSPPRVVLIASATISREKTSENSKYGDVPAVRSHARSTGG